MDAFEKVFAILVAAVLMFIVPLYYIMQQSDSMSQAYVTKKTDEFVEAVRNNGYLDDSMYRKYAQCLSTTNILYEVSMVHEHCAYEPVYDDISNVFTGEVEPVYYDSYQQDILDGLGEDGVYYLSAGDYFSITVYNKTPTLAGRFYRMLYGMAAPERQIFVTDGGRVRDENY